MRAGGLWLAKPGPGRPISGENQYLCGRSTDQCSSSFIRYGPNPYLNLPSPRISPRFGLLLTLNPRSLNECVGEHREFSVALEFGAEFLKEGSLDLGVLGAGVSLGHASHRFDATGTRLQQGRSIQTHVLYGQKTAITPRYRQNHFPWTVLGRRLPPLASASVQARTSSGMIVRGSRSLPKYSIVARSRVSKSNMCESDVRPALALVRRW